jgi:acyl carrier protein
VTGFETWLTRTVADLLGLPDVDRDLPLTELGLSSREAVALTGRISDQLGIPVEPTLLWERPTIRELTCHLAGGPPEHPGGTAGRHPFEALLAAAESAP